MITKDSYSLDRAELTFREDDMRPLRRATTLVSGLLLSAVLTACGSSSSGGSDNAGVSPSTNSSIPAGPTVTIKDFKFSPATLNVKVGTTVTFVQEDSIPHNAHGDGSSDFINSPTLTKGQTYTVTFNQAGTYPYICSIHPFMHGSVVVS